MQGSKKPALIYKQAWPAPMAGNQARMRLAQCVRSVIRKPGGSMHKIEYFKANNHQGRWLLAMSNATIAIALGIISSLSPLTARAQSTTSTVFGHAPAGEVVTATGETGLHRHGSVNSQGRYKLGSLPMGAYTVTLEKDGKAVDTRHNISLLAGQNAEVDFACPNDHCEAAENR
jgi:surface antigen